MGKFFTFTSQCFINYDTKLRRWTHTKQLMIARFLTSAVPLQSFAFFINIRNIFRLTVLCEKLHKEGCIAYEYYWRFKNKLKKLAVSVCVKIIITLEIANFHCLKIFLITYNEAIAIQKVQGAAFCLCNRKRYIYSKFYHHAEWVKYL